MSDISGNDNYIDFEDQEEIEGDSNGTQTTILESAYDYTPYFENIENLFKFQIAVIIGFLLLVGFVAGWKK